MHDVIFDLRVSSYVEVYQTAENPALFGQIVGGTAADGWRVHVAELGAVVTCSESLTPGTMTCRPWQVL